MAETLSIGELLARADREGELVLLDVRNDEEFAAWRLDARRPIETLHIPYFDFLEDAEAALARVPREREIAVVCAKGGSSEMVADLLARDGIRAASVEGGMRAYGEHLEPARVPTDTERLELWQLNRRSKGCLSYVVRSRGEAIVVDPSRNVQAYLSFVAGLGARIVRVLDTHVHADHQSGGPDLAARAGAPYSVNAGEGIELKQRVLPFADGERLRVGDASVGVLAAPGHTPGSTLFRVGARHLLSGDTLFVSSVGRPDLGGQVAAWAKALFRTLRVKIAVLSDDTVVLPAHYASAVEIGEDGLVAGRLGELRRRVPEMQIASEEDFVAAMVRAEKPAPAGYANLIRINLGQASAPLAQVEEWELGKNECAASAAAAAAPKGSQR